MNIYWVLYLGGHGIITGQHQEIRAATDLAPSFRLLSKASIGLSSSIAQRRHQAGQRHQARNFRAKAICAATNVASRCCRSEEAHFGRYICAYKRPSH